MNRLARIEAEVLRLKSEMERIEPISGIGTMVADSPTGKGRPINTAVAVGTVAPCDFKCTGFTEDDTHYVRVTWGRVNGGQPTQFDGVLSVTNEVATAIYIFVYAEYDMVTAQWSERNIIFSEDPDIPNTAVRAYAQIGAAVVTDDVLTVTGACGPVTLNPCDLLIE